MRAEQAGPPRAVLRARFGQRTIRHRLQRTARMDHLVDNSPIGQPAEIAIVDKDIDRELAAQRLGRTLIGVVGIDGIELQPARTAVVDRLLQQLALAHRPKDKLMAILLLQATERLDSKRNGFPDTRILVGDDGAIEINRNSHSCKI